MESSVDLNDSLVGMTDEIVDDDIQEFIDQHMAVQEKIKIVEKVFTEIFTVVGVANICANLIIAYAIVKYRKLRIEKSNIIILNFTVFDCLFAIFMPIGIRFRKEYPFSWIICLAVEIEFTLVIGGILVIYLLTIHWYLKLYHPVQSGKFTKRVNLLLACLYAFIAFCTGLGADTCYDNGLYTFVRVGVLLFFVIYAIMMIVINVLHFVKKKRLTTNTRNEMYPMILSNTFFVSKLPLLLTMSIELVFPFSFEYHFPVLMAVTCSAVVSVMNGLYFFIVLYFFSNDFKAIFTHMFSCKHNEYSEQIIEPRVIYNDTTVLVED